MYIDSKLFQRIGFDICIGPLVKVVTHHGYLWCTCRMENDVPFRTVWVWFGLSDGRHGPDAVKDVEPLKIEILNKKRPDPRVPRDILHFSLMICLFVLVFC